MRGCTKPWLDCHIKDRERACVRIDDPGADPGKISLLELGCDTGFHCRSPSELALRLTPYPSLGQQNGSPVASTSQAFVKGCRPIAVATSAISLDFSRTSLRSYTHAPSLTTSLLLCAAGGWLTPRLVCSS